MSSLKTAFTPVRFGGDYAGYVGTFSPVDGSLIPLPPHMVPEEMVQWGQAPSSLEILVSEEETATACSRQTLAVLPAIDCGVENLETQKSQEIYPKETTQIWKDESQSSVQTMDTVMTPSSDEDQQITMRLETSFGLPEAHLVRVSFNVQVTQQQPDNAPTYQIQSPVRIQLERQVSEVSTRGTRAQGGPLDSGTVATLIGESLRKQSNFAERPSSKGGTWKPAGAKEEEACSSSMQVLHLPGNISIASGPNKENNTWILQVSHCAITPANDNPTRRLVQRTFRGMERTIQYTEEAGEYEYNT